MKTGPFPTGWMQSYRRKKPIITGPPCSWHPERSSSFRNVLYPAWFGPGSLVGAVEGARREQTLEKGRAH